MRWTFAAALCLLAATAEAQVYRFRTHTSSSGLPNNAIYAIHQDAQGYVWFATDGGAARYDGADYQVFSVPQGLVDASVRGFVEDGQGTLWILTKGGVSRFDGRQVRDSFTAADGLPSEEVRAGTRTRDGALWLGSGRGLARYADGRFTRYGTEQGLPDAPVWALLEDTKGVLWVALRGGGLARREGDRFRVYGTAEGLPSLDVFALAEAEDGTLWLGAQGGLVHFDGRGFRTYGTADGLPATSVSSVLVDKHGRVWCGTFGGGIARLEGGRFTVFNRRHGVPDDYITALHKDRENNVWFGSLFTGAFRFVSERFATFNAAWGLGEGMVTGVGRTPDGSLWFSSVNAGLSRLGPDGAVERFGQKQGLADERLWALHVDTRGRVWTGGLFGVSILEGGHVRNLPLSALGSRDRINAIADGGKGIVWLGSGAARSAGVIAWDGASGRAYTAAAHGLAHDQVNSFLVDRAGRLWVCTEDGLSRLDGERFTTWRKAQGLPTKRVMVAHEDGQGVLWLGTPAGLVRFDGQGFRTFTTRDGLVNDFVSALTSHEGTLWVGTAGGISAFDGQRFHNYTVQDGLLSHEISTGTALRQDDGTIWFGSAAGAVRYQPVKPTSVDLPPTVHVKAVRARERTLDWSAPLVLAPSDNSLAFEFLGLSFTDEGAIRYSYTMQGLDGDWSPPDASRSVRFMNLQPGSYQFQVKARSAAGLWSEPATVAFTVQPAFWQTWWFRALLLALAVAAGYAFYGWRAQVLLERNRARLLELRRLLDSIRVINSGLELSAVLENIAVEAARLVDGEPGAIGLVKDGRLAFSRVWLEGAWEKCDLSVKLGEGIAGEVALSGTAHVVMDLPTDPGPGLPSWFARAYAHGFIDVPITDRSGTVVGVLDVRRRAGARRVDDNDRRLLESLAHQAAIALENARLYGDLEEKKIVLSESVWAIEELYKNEMQTTRILQEVNEMKTNFMIVTSHEMRTPLTILKGHQEALLGGFLGTLTEVQKGTLEICRKNVERLITSFNAIIEMLKIDQRAPVDPQPITLVSELEEVLGELRPFADRRKQKLVLEAAADAPLVVADAEKMRLVFANLVQNAIKFTPDGGRVGVRLAREGSGVHVVVEDDGIGIAADELERVFDRFYTSRDSLHHGSGTYQFRARGAGLGLSIAKGYVEAHGGRIWAESAGTGQGSRFHVVLPGAEADQRTPNPPPFAPPPRRPAAGPVSGAA